MTPEKEIHVLVTGGHGALGQRVVAELHRRGHHAYPASRRSTDGDVVLDVRDADGLDQLLDRRPMTHVIHLAAVLGLDAEADPARAIEVNVAGTAVVLEACARHRVRRVVQMSSKAVFGDIGGPHGPPGYQPVAEATISPNPVSVYGLTKLAAEHLAAVARRRNQLDVVSIRSGTTFGPGKGPQHQSGSWPGRIVEAAVRSESIDVPLGGDASDDLIGYEDLAWAIVEACVHDGPLEAVYHIGTGHGSTLHDIFTAVRRRIPDATATIAGGTNMFGFDHNLHCVLDISLARRDLKYRPRSLQQSVDSYLAALGGSNRRGCSG